MNARIPAEVFAPGEFLDEELKARGWSQVELAEILGRPPRLISEIIAGKRAITPETAIGFAAAFGTSAQLWMNLETSYQLSKARIPETEVTRRARLYGAFPVKELIKRGWIEVSKNIEVLEQRFLDFFCMSSMEDRPTFAHAAKTSVYKEPNILKLAWLNRARQVAQASQVGKYSEKALREAIVQLQGCLENVEDIRKVPQILAHAGVRFVIVEHLGGDKMDGACFWIKDSPVVALSLRYDRVDNFWFSLFHELDHVLHGEGRDHAIYEVIDQGAEKLPTHEVRANHAAASYCIERKEMEGFIARVGPLFSKSAIVGFAMRLHIHPGLVVGQLQGRKLIQYSYHREMLVKVRSIVTMVVLTDGFGNRVPV